MPSFKPQGQGRMSYALFNQTSRVFLRTRNPFNNCFQAQCHFYSALKLCYAQLVGHIDSIFIDFGPLLSMV